jgi:hypothetical protein
MAKLGDDYKLIKSVHDRKSLLDQLLGVFYKSSPTLQQSTEYTQQQLRSQLCGNSRQLTLAYHGDLASICQ